jgi:hypothetical protein
MVRIFPSYLFSLPLTVSPILLSLSLSRDPVSLPYRPRRLQQAQRVASQLRAGNGAGRGSRTCRLAGHGGKRRRVPPSRPRLGAAAPGQPHMGEQRHVRPACGEWHRRAGIRLASGIIGIRKSNFCNPSGPFGSWPDSSIWILRI